MSNELIVDIGVGGNRVALLEDNELVEIYIERLGTERMIGNIYRGKVSSVLPGMQAAFVDIGFEKNAFLYAGDVIARRDYSDDDKESTEQELRECNIAICSAPGRADSPGHQGTDRFKGTESDYEYHAPGQASCTFAGCGLYRGIQTDRE